ncbi:MAG: PQQ-binding-like beta-propeller repeat protein [Gammaproteobacteria bacterium]
MRSHRYGSSRGMPLIALLASAAIAQAQEDPGAQVWDTHCAVCHRNPVDDDVPALEVLRTLGPDAILRSLTDGNMRIQGQMLAQDERTAVAEFLAGRRLATAASLVSGGRCSGPPEPLTPGPPGTDWNGWGPDARNARFMSTLDGLDADSIPDLELKWAFAVPGATQSRSQPAVINGRLFMASDIGTIYALDAATGCTYWTFQADASVRTAISVGPVPTGYGVFFADAAARAYAIDADTGQRIWTRKVDFHPAARATGAPVLHDGVLYVPQSGVSEENVASMPDYECCTFRGAITALDAGTGDQIWKTYVMPEPRPRGLSSTGKQLWGPAGAAIWSSPTVDPRRGVIYAATGNAYADPPMPTSNAIIAFDMDTGAIRWINQVLPGDVWIMRCDPRSGGPEAADNPNCPENVGPDFDFSASPALTTLDNGKDLLVVTQKSGVGYALDPDNDGATLWEYRWGRGSPVGGVWGASTDGDVAYFAVADQFTDEPGGIHAVELATGARVWFTGPQPPLCDSGPGCSSAQSAALTSVPGAVISGGADGGVRAYSKRNGRIIWSYDTNRDFETVNGVPGRGGAIDGPGPVVAGGMLYVTSGNGGIVGTPGNVLLAFSIDN